MCIRDRISKHCEIHRGTYLTESHFRVLWHYLPTSSKPDTSYPEICSFPWFNILCQRQDVYKRQHMISIIAAVDRKRGIGYQNRLLFWLPNDLKRFKALTTGTVSYTHLYIEGHISPKVTFESYDTICRQVANRIPNIRKFAASHDLIFFVSGKMCIRDSIWLVLLLQ